MDETRKDGRRLYKARGPDGEVAWVDHDELWRLQQEQAERVRRERARRQRSVLLALAALVAVALVLVLFRLRLAGPPPAAEVVASAPVEAAAESAAPASAGQPPAVEAPTTEAAPDPEGAVELPPPTQGAGEVATTPDATERAMAAVRSWAAAWGRRDVDAYLTAYGDGFEPADGSSRSSWQAQRRRRLTTPDWIRVEIEGLEVLLLGDGRAEARFLQSYTSADYADVVRKTLELVEEGGQWRILAERAETP